jgi:hypothetical protein
MSRAMYLPLRKHVLQMINDSETIERARKERVDHLSIDLAQSLWGHIDINPFQIASELNKYLIQMGIYERGQLLVKVSPATSLLTLTFPLTVSVDGRDDPDRIYCFD